MFDELLGLAFESVKEGGLSFDTEVFLEVLQSRIDEEDLDGQESVDIRPSELVEPLEKALNRKIWPQWVAERFRSLGCKRTGRDNKGVIYSVELAKLSEIRSRYTPPECSTPLHQPNFTPA